ncbi:hypothetical protein HII31_10697 [Pseudocercospora fuligena]|uniref:(S)-ureidoglycine aminohydrolase cupin domain-containing protein n=1 Tax=Pseudocercospora fuligena TaxID=685502 RepID=A0A8H6VES1_9PEZI|nr:hypothetical protein HII31_10697 [Pseudocercospora fuligena]
MAPPIPFSSLPVDKSGPHHNAWGTYGKDDQLGTLNRLSDDVVKAAASEIQTGTRINLDWPLDAQADVPFFGRQSFEKNVYQKPPRIVNDDVWTFNTQSSSQWDGFRHFAYQKEARFYKGVTLDEIHGRNGVEKTNNIGIGAWAEKGIVGRGILLDYHEYRLKNKIPHNALETGAIPAETLRDVARSQGTEIKFGDLLFVRSGYLDAYNKLSRPEIETLRAKQPLTFTGVEQSEDMMEFMWNNFSACAADHPSWEAWPTQKDYSLHEVMLAGWGMPIGELFDLEKLAAHLSSKLVPLTIVKGAGYEHIPLPQGENATVADFHSIRTKTNDTRVTSGFYIIEAGPERPAHYTFEEAKYVLSGQIDILDEATGVTHHLVPGDFAFFHVGSKVKFSTKSKGFAFYVVTRDVKTPHPNLQGREEDVKAKL